MNLATGVFTVPTNGTYFFSFTARANVNDSRVRLEVNGVDNAFSRGNMELYNMPLSATLKLKKGDRVDIFLQTGSLYDDGSRQTQFSGILLEEDLTVV